MWKVLFYRGVEDDILKMPPGVQARMFRLLETMEKFGPFLGSPHTKSLKDGLFEVRGKASEGIARGLYCYRKEQEIYVLHAFVKKDKAIPQKDLRLARKRLREVMEE